MESIENKRKNVIDEIKEKVKKNPKYLHPTNKERLEDMKKLMFVSGNEFVDWMRQNGILVNTISIRHKNIRKIIENAGCKTSKNIETNWLKEQDSKTLMTKEENGDMKEEKIFHWNLMKIVLHGLENSQRIL